MSAGRAGCSARKGSAPLVGDRVNMEVIDQTSGLIPSDPPRKNVLNRPAAGGIWIRL
jgi:putative ribosome biogenesis GTPase RsgA